MSRPAPIIALLLALCACSRPASDESYSRLSDGDAFFSLDMADSIKYSLEMLVFADEVVVQEDIPFELTLTSPSARIYREVLSLLPADMKEVRGSGSLFHKIIRNNFAPAEYGTWNMNVRFLTEDIEKYSIQGVGSRLKRGE